MKIDGKFILSYHIASILIGSVLFLYGFFPITYSNDRRADLKDLPNSIDNIPYVKFSNNNNNNHCSYQFPN